MKNSKVKIILMLVLSFIMLSVSACGTVTGGGGGGEIDPPKPKPPTTQEMIDDPMADVDFTDEYEKREALDPEWQEIVATASPLNVGDKYVEDFSKAVFKQRLRPYTRFYEIPDIEQGAQWQYVGTDKRSVLVTTDGEKNGAFDYMEFAGMRYTENALYKLKVDYTVKTVNRIFKFGFGHEYILDLVGNTLNEKKSEEGTFVADTAVGYNGNQIISLLLMVAGGKTGASIEINAITITRLADRPRITNAKITGAYEVGSTLTLSYDFVGDALESGTKIRWTLSSDKKGKNLTVLSAFNDSKTMILDSNMSGSFIGVKISPRMDVVGESALGKEVSLIGNSFGAVAQYPKFKFDSVGKKIIEDFENVNANANIGFSPDDGVTSYISDNNPIAGGKSLYMYVPKDIKGIYFDDLIFSPNGRYKITMKYRLSVKPTELVLQFRALSALGYAGDIKMNLPIGASELNVVNEAVLPATTIKDVEGYQLQLFSLGKCEMMIDDFVIERVEDNVTASLNSLKNVGGSIFDDFDSSDTLGNINNFGWSGIYVSGNNGILGNSLTFVSTKLDGGITAYFETLKGYLTAGGTYKVTFKYKVITDIMPKQFYVGMRTNIGNQVNFILDFTSKTVNTVYDYSQSFTLENADNYYMQMFNLSGNDKSCIIIDNIKIERTK